MTSEIRTSVYYNPEPLKSLNSNTKSCDRIGALWNGLRHASDPSEYIPLLGKLGVAQSDLQAHEALIPMIQGIFQNIIQISHTECADDSGIFFFSARGKKIAVFKPSPKRARMEVLARQIAHRVGLEKHAIAGMYCTLEYPSFPDSVELRVELWNGNIKVFRSNLQSKKNYNQQVIEDNNYGDLCYKITGILEPYIEPGPQADLEELSFMTLFALIIGLRDGKSDAFTGSTFFDLEDLMPERFLPDRSPNRKVAATHLPFLTHPLAQQTLSIDLLRNLAHKLDFFSPDALMKELGEERVEIADMAAESFELNNSMSPADINGWDDGGCPVVIKRSQKIMDREAVFEVKSFDQPLLTEGQLIALGHRVQRLRESLESQVQIGSGCTLVDLVRSVDVFYDEHMKALAARGIERPPPAEIVGKFTPDRSGSPIPLTGLENILLEQRRTPSPPLSVSASTEKLY